MSSSRTEAAGRFVDCLLASIIRLEDRDKAQAHLDETLKQDVMDRHILGREMVIERDAAYTESLEVLAEAMRAVLS